MSSGDIMSEFSNPTKTDHIIFSHEDWNSFFRGYVHGLLWSSTVYGTESGEADDGLPETTDIELSDEILKELAKDAGAMFVEILPFMAQLSIIRSYNFDNAGTDFALSRNGHGTGYWDRGLGEVGHRLHSMAKAYGDQHISVWRNDDGDVEIEVGQ